jgi:hypothetical protein
LPSLLHVAVRPSGTQKEADHDPNGDAHLNDGMPIVHIVQSV